jgi:hypothetical protein
MEAIILLLLSIIFLIFGNRIADSLSARNMTLYKKMFGERIEKHQTFIRNLNRWGIRFGALIFFLIFLALVFGPIQG